MNGQGHCQGHCQGHSTRPGSTIVEQLWVLLLCGVLLGIASTVGGRLLDSAAVHTAASDVTHLFALARDQAIATGQRTAVRVSVAEGRLVVHSDIDTVARLELGQTRAVLLASTRDSMAYTSSGLGYGASNLRVIVSRGASAETVTVSRLGRVRR